MFMKHRDSGDLVEILDPRLLFDPFEKQVRGRTHAGEEMPDEGAFGKEELVFPSGEALPRCWVDPNYRTH